MIGDIAPKSVIAARMTARETNDLPAVDDITDRPGRKGQNEERQCGCCLSERHVHRAA